MTQTVTVDVVADFVCPWCHVGEARLAQARALVPEIEVTVRRWPFELNPDMPEAGMERSAYRLAKFGSLERSRQLDARLIEMSTDDGVTFAFDRMTRTPNSRRAHRVMRAAERAGIGEMVGNRLYRAYFEEALDIGDAQVLTRLMDEIGHPELIEAAETLEAEVAGLLAQAGRSGIQGVPFFVIGGQALPGAYPADALADAIRAAAK